MIKQSLLLEYPYESVPPLIADIAILILGDSRYLDFECKHYDYFKIAVVAYYRVSVVVTNEKHHLISCDVSGVVFVDEPVWTVAPASWGAWFRQRLFGWYPGLYHQLPNMLRVLVSWRSPWRLRYEMAYALYAIVSDPFKVIGLAVLLAHPALWGWIAVLYLTYLVFEFHAWRIVRLPGSGARASLPVLFTYPLYGFLDTLMRALSLFTWLWMRFVTRAMRPRPGRLRDLPTPSNAPEVKS